MIITNDVLHQKLKEGNLEWNNWLQELVKDIPKIMLRTNKPLRETKIDKIYLKITFPELIIENESFENYDFINLNWSLSCKKVSFKNCKFKFSNFNKSTFNGCFFIGCHFEETFLLSSVFNFSTFKNCKFKEANLSKGEFFNTLFEKCIVNNTNLMWTKLIETKFINTSINNCKIFGSAIWNIQIDKDTRTKDLIISKKKEAEIKIDNIEIAQFVYLLLNNQKIREVITTLTSKLVLILGRFTFGRVEILNEIKEHLTQKGFVPILFTFEPSPNRDITETIQLLANISKIVIADITEPKSIPQELSHIIPSMPSLPIQPIILYGEIEYGMYEHWDKYPWVKPIIQYQNTKQLLQSLDTVL